MTGGSPGADTCPTNGAAGTFVPGHDDLEKYIRICFSYEEEENLAEGVIRLAALIKRNNMETNDID